ncbi:hypothetical protein KY290_013382 [Solanum tuberosum]|uniref:Uncharacterized protein n=1 Tax=Solanum tuberosum TaxID=4113 RepID=A0ABQ7VJJ2_SOLTU|nr:hypothetical protein KY289_013133 [Solanum tuberosum]KAH0697762.1 hypothetical protein KY289_015244 [Solanum tuberosum]KAH0697796.1 hypothetical protein KY289_015278 [Solanum tuberosum]KAH0697826.1 hypothetical protein KY289_015308 [Solanum tuberosum]KAH0768599.1 hypothetical protein KY290_012580 [Solanum tuberosum]
MANSRRSRGGSRYGARQHQPRPARIGRGMWASGKRRRPTSDGFSQGLHASPFACTHRSVDVGRGQPASPFSCPKRSVDVARGVPASPFACTHCSVDVGRGLPASPFACAHRSVDVGRGLAASAFACPHRSVDVGRGVPASAAACATLVEVSSTTCGCPCIPKIIKSAKHPSRITIYSSIFHHLFSTFPPRVSLVEAKVCLYLTPCTFGLYMFIMILGRGVPHRPCPVRIAQPTSAVAFPHRPWTARPWSRSRRTSPSRIARGLAASAVG